MSVGTQTQSPSGTKDSPTLKPLRLSPKQAGDLLIWHPEYVRRRIREGLFTPIYSKGKAGTGKRVYLHPDEVNVLALNGEAALRAFRIKMGRLKPNKKASSN